VLVWYRMGETQENGKVSVMMCVGLVQGGETEGNRKCSVMMCGSLLQSGGDGGKWKGFSADAWWFGPGWGIRREMERVEC
jgi:hypothetical protein